MRVSAAAMPTDTAPLKASSVASERPPTHDAAALVPHSSPIGVQWPTGMPGWLTRARGGGLGPCYNRGLSGFPPWLILECS